MSMDAGLSEGGLPSLTSIIQKLHRTTSPSIATLLHKRGLRHQHIAGVRSMAPRMQPMVGPAQTLRYIPAREDVDTVAVFADPLHPQRVAVDSARAGAVLVMDCRRETDVASCGSILFARLVARGCAGLVTDGAVRDSADISKAAIPCFAAGAAAPTNLSRHHAVDIDVPIGCGGAPVYPGDIIFGDDDGVIVIPRHLAAEVADEALEMEAFEGFAMAEVERGASIIGLYPPNEATLERYRSLPDEGK